MWDARAALTQLYCSLISTIKCISNYLMMPSNSEENRLPIAMVPSSGNQNQRSSPGLLMQIVSALSQAYCWLMSTINVFVKFFNISPIHDHNTPQSQNQQGQAQSQHHQTNIPNPIRHDMNPITSLFQSQELSKVVLSLVPPITGLLLNESKNIIFPQSRFITVTLYLGTVATFNGILLRAIYPRAASVLEKLGVALIFLGFFRLSSLSLLSTPEWFYWLCFALFCVPLVLSILPFKFADEVNRLDTNHPDLRSIPV